MAEWKMLYLPSVLLLWPQIFLQDHSPPGIGCLSTTDTKVPVKNLRSFTRQRKPVFPVDAVRFLTVKGITICSDPSSSWAVKAMKYLDEKKKPQSGLSKACQSVTATWRRFQLDGLAWEEEEEGSACLNTTDTKVPVRNLCSFSIQCKPVFPVDAVRFLTIKGNTICSDPSSAWAVKSVKYLDEKKKRQSASARRSVTAAPNTMSTINTKSAQSSTTQIWSTPDTKQKTENKTEFPTARTTLEPDRRRSTETTETWEEEEEEEEADAVTGSACLSTTDTKVPVMNLCSFSIQCKPVFPVDAVRFLTIKRITICSDPSSSWAVKAMKYLDENMKPQSASSTDHQFVTTNAKSAQSSTIQICSPPENYTQSLRDIKHRTENETEFPTARTTLEPDWRGSTETTETFQLEEEESSIMNEPFIDRFCLKGEQVKHSDP